MAMSAADLDNISRGQPARTVSPSASPVSSYNYMGSSAASFSLSDYARCISPALSIMSGIGRVFNSPQQQRSRSRSPLPRAAAAAAYMPPPAPPARAGSPPARRTPYNLPVDDRGRELHPYNGGRGGGNAPGGRPYMPQRTPDLDFEAERARYYSEANKYTLFKESVRAMLGDNCHQAMTLSTRQYLAMEIENGAIAVEFRVNIAYSRPFEGGSLVRSAISIGSVDADVRGAAGFILAPNQEERPVSQAFGVVYDYLWRPELVQHLAIDWPEDYRFVRFIYSNRGAGFREWRPISVVTHILRSFAISFQNNVAFLEGIAQGERYNYGRAARILQGIEHSAPEF